jgi:S1-C subfamily serine protease
MFYRVNQTGLYIISSKDSRLNPGDRIVGVNDVTVSDMASFKAALGKYKVGDMINITVARGSEQVTVGITLGELKP